MNKKSQITLIIAIILILIIGGIFYQKFLKTQNINPICGNNVCENYNNFNENSLCPQDCGDDLKPIIQPKKPICNNNLCEVSDFHNIDEFNSCPSDCGGKDDTVRVSQPRICQEPTHVNPFIIDIYSLYNSKIDIDAETQIRNSINCASQFLKTYQGRTYKIRNFNKIQIKSLTFENKDIFDTLAVNDGNLRPNMDNIRGIFNELNQKSNIKQDYETSYASWMFLGDTYGGSFTFASGSPVFHSENIYDYNLPMQRTSGQRIVHENLHNYGCEHEIKNGCIMYDLNVTNLNNALCSCKPLYIGSNYRKTRFKDLTVKSLFGLSLIQENSVTNEGIFER